MSIAERSTTKMKVEVFQETQKEKKEYEEWLEFSKMDFISAKYLYESVLNPKPLNIVCYHCQQAAEKAIKALILYLDNYCGMPKVHDISFLLNQVKNAVINEKVIEIPKGIIEAADFLSRYGISLRYPSEKWVDEVLTDKALLYSEKILKWVETIIDIDLQ